MYSGSQKTPCIKAALLSNYFSFFNLILQELYRKSQWAAIFVSKGHLWFFEIGTFVTSFQQMKKNNDHQGVYNRQDKIRGFIMLKTQMHLNLWVGDVITWVRDICIFSVKIIKVHLKLDYFLSSSFSGIEYDHCNKQKKWKFNIKL